MPPRAVLPPVECCFGTNPSEAEKSRALLNLAALPIAAMIAVADSVPMPGTDELTDPERHRLQSGS